MINMKLKYLKNDRGLGMVEILVASAITLVVLASTTILFTRNQSQLQDESDSTNIQAKGRLAVDRIEEEIRMAGFGLPPLQGVTVINANSISFRTNLDDVRTITPPCIPCPGTIAGSVGDTTLTVLDETGFSNGDKIIIRDPNFNKWELNTVTGTSAGTLNLGTALTNDYVYGINTSLVTVNKYSDVTIALNGTDITRTVDSVSPSSPVVTNLISDVDATNGIVFNYFGVTVPSSVLRLGFNLSLVDPTNPAATVEFKTDVSLRNS
jgi:Tfp pilus assembly protein PilW